MEFKFLNKEEVNTATVGLFNVKLSILGDQLRNEFKTKLDAKCKSLHGFKSVMTYRFTNNYILVLMSCLAIVNWAVTVNSILKHDPTAILVGVFTTLIQLAMLYVAVYIETKKPSVISQMLTEYHQEFIEEVYVPKIMHLAKSMGIKLEIEFTQEDYK